VFAIHLEFRSKSFQNAEVSGSNFDSSFTEVLYFEMCSETCGNCSTMVRCNDVFCYPFCL